MSVVMFSGTYDRKRHHMIVYDLQCLKGHRFEGWFDDAESFEYQKNNGLLSCPFCEDTHITKIPSTFAIKTSMPPPSKDDTQQNVNPEVVAKKLKDYLEKNFENVGCNFAKEALKIHYGVSEVRNIRGFSTKEEEKCLRNEGIDFFKIPVPASLDEPDEDS